jgi:hypothetical protein
MADQLIVGPTLYRDIRRARDYAAAGRETVSESTSPDQPQFLACLAAIEKNAEEAMEIIERNNPKLSVVQEEEG